MNNYSNILFPEIINEAFPIINDASYVRQLASLVPLCPDTIFHLVSDKPDPTNQSVELKQICGEYEFEFTNLVKPYTDDKYIEVRENDEMNESFSVPDPNSYYHYYLAAVKQKLDWQ